MDYLRKWDGELNIGLIPKKWSFYAPEKTAIIYYDGKEEKKITYKELNERVNRVANYMLSKGIKKGDRVSVLLFNCNEFLEIYFAASKIGAIFAPLNYRLAPPEVEFQLNDAGTKMLFFHPELTKVVDAIRDKVPVEHYIFVGDAAECPEWAEHYESVIAEQPVTEPKFEWKVNWEDPHVIMYTSGVTGRPKGCLMSYRKIFFNVFNADQYYDGLRPDDVYVSPLPLFHSGGLFIVAVPTLYKGGTYITMRRFDPAKGLEFVEKYKATIFFALTTMVNFMLKAGTLYKYDLSSLRKFLTGGERTPPYIWEELRKLSEKFGFDVNTGFGLTENSILLFNPKVLKGKTQALGIPVFFCEVEILDENGNILPPRQIGEICVKGPTNMLGYWNMPEETKKAFRFGWLHTGDLGYKDEDGYVYFVDREKDMYRSGGENVYPAEIEKILNDHPKILEVSVIGVPDEKWGETGMAFIVLKDGETITKEEILSYLEGKLARYKIPKYAVIVKELPHTASGKIQKVALKQLAKEKFDELVKKAIILRES